MIYYKDEHVLIRGLDKSDAAVFAAEECAQGWHTEEAKFISRLKDVKDGIAISFVAEYDGFPAGYVNIYPNAPWGSFGGMGYTEIIDFGVLEKYRNRGIGSKLMDVAEKIASEYSDTVYLAVGLYRGYGSAQRMYVKRGYIPDGKGAWYGEELCEPYGTYRIDDEFTLYLSKKLK
ncbi:MAG: GNAT family N-acetyltransferase [Clostridia bacterium]|nr:GNAT family N-acetyltransferase [Clostridia bacterium]